MRVWPPPAIQTIAARFVRTNRQRAILPVCGQGEVEIPGEHWFRRKQGRGEWCVDQALSCGQHSSFALASQGLHLSSRKNTQGKAWRNKFYRLVNS